MLCFGYWQFGNRQIFFNEASEKETSTDQRNPNHFLIDFKDFPDHTFIFLLFIPVFLFFEQLFNGLRIVASKCKLLKELRGIDLYWNIDIQVNENLGNYWNCIRGQL